MLNNFIKMIKLNDENKLFNAISVNVCVYSVDCMWGKIKGQKNTKKEYCSKHLKKRTANSNISSTV